MFCCLLGFVKALVKRVPGVEEQASSKQPDAFKSHDKSDAGKGLSLKGKERKRRAGSPRLKMVKKRPRDDADANKPSAETVQLATKIKAFHNSIQDIAVSALVFILFKFTCFTWVNMFVFL